MVIKPKLGVFINFIKKMVFENVQKCHKLFVVASTNILYLLAEYKICAKASVDLNYFKSWYLIYKTLLFSSHWSKKINIAKIIQLVINQYIDSSTLTNSILKKYG